MVEVEERFIGRHYDNRRDGDMWAGQSLICVSLPGDQECQGRVVSRLQLKTRFGVVIGNFRCTGTRSMKTVKIRSQRSR